MGAYEVYVSQYVLGGLSVLCSLASIAIVLWVWMKQPSSKESPSFCLTLWISIADLPLRVSDFFSVPLSYPEGYPTSRSFARFMLWLNFFGCFWFIYLTSMITLDLQLVFFHRLPRQARIRRWYPMLGTVIALLLSIPYLCFPNVRLSYNGVLMVGYEGSPALRAFILWNNIFMHLGIVYSLVVVIAVCIKVFVSQSHLRRFDEGEHSKAMSRALIRNTRLIIAYPVVLFVVYVPYVLASWFNSYIPGYFAMRWTWFSNILFASQGIFSFAILLFHPVMLSTYRQNNFGFSSLWSQVSRRLGGTSGSTYNTSLSNTNASNNRSYPYSTAASNTQRLDSSGMGGLDIQTVPPQIKTMDMGPGVTGFFDGHYSECDTHTTSSVHKLKGLEGIEAINLGEPDDIERANEQYPLLDDPTCL
ncbi:hypothetical protein IWQ61_004778 [Dispira simplex]|nr:hypothetical protein IWQ61_004778 [Dispira simplex]